MNSNKPGRPTTSIKDNMLKVRLDSDMLETLDKIAEEKKQNRSEIIRSIIPIISSNDFENMIAIDTLQRLEEYSIRCNEAFEQKNIKIKVDEVSLKFPAFVSTISEPPILYIKYPTYKIRILLLKHNAIAEIIQPLLKDINGISKVYETQCVLMKSESLQATQTFLPELMCLKHTLSENSLLKDVLCSILDDNDIQYEIWPAYYITGKIIKIINEDKQSYIVNV